MITREILMEIAEEVSRKISNGMNFMEGMVTVLADHRIYNILERKICFQEVGKILGSRNKGKKKRK